jgi:hypothetical protein
MKSFCKRVSRKRPKPLSKRHKNRALEEKKCSSDQFVVIWGCRNKEGRIYEGRVWRGESMRKKGQYGYGI